MVVSNCVGAISDVKLSVQAITITAVLILLMIGYKHIAKKKLSPIILIVLSAVAGMVVYGV